VAQGAARQRSLVRESGLLRKQLTIPAIVLLLLSLPVFARLVGGANPASVFSDYPAHLHQVLLLAERGVYPPHPLYHLCVALLVLGNRPTAIVQMAGVTLALATSARAYLTAFILVARNTLPVTRVVGLCVALALVMPLPNWWLTPDVILPGISRQLPDELPSPLWWQLPSVFWGDISPNVWHNPTGVFAMPFCLLLFHLGWRALQAPGLASMAAAGAAIVLSLLAKPNYVLAFGPCFAIAAFIGWFQGVQAGRLTLAKAVGQAAAAFGPGLVVLWLQFRNAFGDASSNGSGLIVAPFLAWGMLSKSILFSILLSLAFPLSVAALYPRRVMRDRQLAFAWAVSAVAVTQFALLTETGERLGHGNFRWGCVLANQVLFVVSCEFLLSEPASRSRAVAFLVLWLHVLSGSICLARCLLSPSLAGLF
jgi:hypothetical protein